MHAQDPLKAGSEGMPTSAINTGLFDIILSPEEMLVNLISYSKSSSKVLKKNTHMGYHRKFYIVHNEYPHFNNTILEIYISEIELKW